MFNLKVLGRDLKQRIKTKQIRIYEMMLVLFSLHANGSLTVSDVKAVLLDVFEGNVSLMVQALDLAKEIVEVDMIEAMIKEE